MNGPDTGAPRGAAVAGGAPGSPPDVHPVHVALLAAITGFFLYVNLKSPTAGEDFALMPWPLGGAPSGLGAQVRATASAMLAQGLHWSWRLGELLAVLFGALPRDVFAVANAGVLTALVVVLFLTAFGRVPDWRRPADAFPLLVLVAALLALLPALGTLWFWRAGTLNHTWGLFFLLSWAVPLRLLATGRDPFARTSAPLVALYCAAGIPAGMTVESAGPIVVGWAVLLGLWKRRSTPRWLPFAAASLAAGTALLLFAPSTSARRAHYRSVVPGDGTTGLALFQRRVAKVFEDHLALTEHLLLLLAALAACWLLVERRALLAAVRRRRVEEPAVRDAAVVAALAITSMGSLLALGTIAYHSDQIRGAALHWYVLFAAVAFLAGGIWVRLPAALRAVAVVLVLAVLGREMGRIAKAYAAYHEEASARHHEIVRQRRAGIADVRVDVLLTPTTRLVDTREEWSAHAEGPAFIARRYGVATFGVGGPPQGARPPEASPPAGRLLHGIDSARVDAGVLEVTGWAFLEGFDAAEQTRQVVLRRKGDGAAATLLLGVSPVVRADVARAFGRTEYARSGFSARVATAALPAGDYEVGVVVAREGASGTAFGGAEIALRGGVTSR